MDSIDKAAEMLFGPNKGFGVSNIRFYPGTNLDVTPEQRADELIKVFGRIKSGKFKVVK